MKQSSSSSLLCSTSYHSPSRPSLFRSSLLPLPSLSKFPSTYSRCIHSCFQSSCLRARSSPISTFHCAVTKEFPETISSGSDFIEIGYIYDSHGLQGEVCVKHNTAFPELRFSTPGKRWLRQQISGREEVTEVELVSGRGHLGRKSWLVRFKGINDIDEAKQLVGATLLVKESDRPKLEEGEFYSRDLIGMRVILKETGEQVGTVASIFNYGADDLLNVLPDSSAKPGQENSDSSGTGHLIRIPFVEAIVRDVDLNKREMYITPPKGLLELNLRSDDRSKKERRLLEWKEKKKFQRRLISAKKKLCVMEQQHVFDGFRFGEESQRNLLADQIVSVNSVMLQHALQSIEMSSGRFNLAEYIPVSTWKTKSSLRVLEEHLIAASKGNQNEYSRMQGVGLDLIDEGKVATILVLNSRKQKICFPAEQPHDSFEDDDSSNISCLKTLLSDDQGFIEIDQRSSVPMITLSPAPEVQAVVELFTSNDYFGFDSEKVWFLEEEKLPVVSSSAEQGKKHKILMKSPWEMLQSPVGSGGIISAFSSSNLIQDLIKMGVEYIEICSITQRSIVGLPIFLGFVNSQGADIGIQVFEDTQDFEDRIHLIISVEMMKKLIARQTKLLKVGAIPKASRHVEKVGKEFVDAVVDSANSYEFHCSIYSLLTSLGSENICVIEVDAE